MDLWQLHILTKVVELKSFSKAGKAVHLSQPTISSHIKDLENHFGCRLIDRLGKEAVPTKSGELLTAYAKRMIALRDEAETAMAEFQGAMRGKITIGGSTIPGGYILPKLLGDFIKQHPSIHVALQIADTEQVIQKVLEGELELGMVGARSTNKHISQFKILEDEMRLIVPPDHPFATLKSVAPKALVKEPFIIREPGSGTLISLQDNLESNGIGIQDLNTVAEMGNTESVKQAIKSGLGISILSRIAVESELTQQTLVDLPIDGIPLKRSFYLTTHKDRTASPISRAFMAFLSGSYPIPAQIIKD